jgi:dihydrofolate reductase
MRKLKLQMQISLDGFVDGPNGLDANWNEEIINYSIENLATVDNVILGGKVARDFVPHWASIAKNPDNQDYFFAKRVTEIPKIAFSNTIKNGDLENTSITKGDLTEEINKIKTSAGKDMLVYGGASFVSNLIKQKLVDECYLLVNPVALGMGVPIFNELENKLKLSNAEIRKFDCDTVLLCYRIK